MTPELDLTIGACAKIARVPRDEIDRAMKMGQIPFHRDSEWRRVTTWSLLQSYLEYRHLLTDSAK